VLLVDTSVWIQHLRAGSDPLKTLLDEGLVFCHPFVIGELACGQMRNRETILQLLSALPQVLVADHGEALELLERYALFGRGVGWIDVHLLAAALLSGVRLWTLDKRLMRIAAELGVSYIA
jgi:hypothetical protein